MTCPRGGDGQVRVEEPASITFISTLTTVKPKDWKLVRKRGIIPDGLVQSKLKSFIAKFPIWKGVSREIMTEALQFRRRGQVVFQMVFRMLTRRRTIILKVKTIIFF